MLKCSISNKKNEFFKITSVALEDRKKDHIQLALESQSPVHDSDSRFYYEPLLSAHSREPFPPLTFLGKQVNVPIWVSSMTGGTQKALNINRNLAAVCRTFGMGMGLGSCRAVMESDNRFGDFDVRHILGHELPLYANLGIAQLEQLLHTNDLEKVNILIDKLQADGLVIHVNPLQEWLQPEGDRLSHPPIDTIKKVVDYLKMPIIVKEVGQGMGPASLKELLMLPLAAIEFGAFGGTNFATVEMKRRTDTGRVLYEPIARLGHSAAEMTQMVNTIISKQKPLCKGIIVSGGINNFLDGYYLTESINMPAMYGQASSMLRYAQQDYKELEAFVESQINGLQLAKAYLRIKQ